MKHHPHDLAILGGEPAFSQALHVGRPFIGDRRTLIKRIEGILDNRRLTNSGPLLNRFERMLSAQLEIEHVIPVANGTLGIMVLLKALGIRGEVIVPSFTYIATAHAVTWQGLTPVFCEIDPHTHNIDPKLVENSITPNTGAILAVHLWGRPCAISALTEIGERHGIPVVFDAAHAFNVCLDGRKIGNFGAAEIFSFHATKFVNSLEGGAIATRDSVLARELRRMIDFGFGDSDEVEGLGINAKMNEFNAAMGLSTLADIREITAINRDTYHAYAKDLAEVPGVELLRFDESTNPNYQYVTVMLDEATFGLSRDATMRSLQAENVLARRYFHPGCHRSPPYATSNRCLPATEAVSRSVLCLPCGADLSPGLVARVVDLLQSIREHADEIRDRLSGLSSGFRHGRRA
ncbi:MAG: DegT/DnrJ/EryC1/StrS family aminotransferase [Pseudomonadales bacterium]